MNLRFPLARGKCRNTGARANVCTRESLHAQESAHGAARTLGPQPLPVHAQVRCARWWMSATVNGWVLQYDCSRVNAWMSATILFQKSECFGMSAAAECCLHTAHRMESRERWMSCSRTCSSLMSLRRTWEVYEIYILASAKEYRSKPDVHALRKLKLMSHVTILRRNNLRCKTTDLLQAMTCIASK